MGIGCVLLFWAIAGAVGATFGAGVLSLAVLLLRRRFPAIRRRWFLVAAGLPFVVLAYAGVAFAAYALWCESVRGVDPGIGDSWHVPLPNGWTFTMIDVSNEGYLTSRTGRQVRHGVTRLGLRNQHVFGEDESGYFLIDTRSESPAVFGSEAELLTNMNAIGASKDDLQKADWFYVKRRWTLADAAAAIVLAFPPLLLIVIVSARLLFIIRRAAQPSPRVR